MRQTHTENPYLLGFEEAQRRGASRPITEGSLDMHPADARPFALGYNDFVTGDPCRYERMAEGRLQSAPPRASAGPRSVRETFLGAKDTYKLDEGVHSLLSFILGQGYTASMLSSSEIQVEGMHPLDDLALDLRVALDGMSMESVHSKVGPNGSTIFTLGSSPESTMSPDVFEPEFGGMIPAYESKKKLREGVGNVIGKDSLWHQHNTYDSYTYPDGTTIRPGSVVTLDAWGKVADYTVEEIHDGSNTDPEGIQIEMGPARLPASLLGKSLVRVVSESKQLKEYRTDDPLVGRKVHFYAPDIGGHVGGVIKAVSDKAGGGTLVAVDYPTGAPNSKSDWFDLASVELREGERNKCPDCGVPTQLGTWEVETGSRVDPFQEATGYLCLECGVVWDKSDLHEQYPDPSAGLDKKVVRIEVSLDEGPNDLAGSTVSGSVEEVNAQLLKWQTELASRTDDWLGYYKCGVIFHFADGNSQRFWHFDIEDPAKYGAPDIRNLISYMGLEESVRRLTEGELFTDSMLDQLRAEYGSFDGRVDPTIEGGAYQKLAALLDTLDQDRLTQLAQAGIKWLSPLAWNRVDADIPHPGFAESKLTELRTRREDAFYPGLDSSGTFGNARWLPAGTRVEIVKDLRPIENSLLIQATVDGDPYYSYIGQEAELSESKLTEAAQGLVADLMTDPGSPFKVEYAQDFTAGFRAGEAQGGDVSSAIVAYAQVQGEFGSWWKDGYTAAIDLKQGAYDTRPAQIARAMGLDESKLQEFTGGISVYALYISDGYLAAASEDEWQLEQLARSWGESDFEVVPLRGVPDDLKAKLIRQGSGDQHFSDGYDAANAAAPYTRGLSREMQSVGPNAPTYGESKLTEDERQEYLGRACTLDGKPAHITVEEGDIYKPLIIADDMSLVSKQSWNGVWNIMDNHGGKFSTVGAYGESKLKEQYDDQPEPEDYTITPTGPLGGLYGVGQIEGNFLGEFQEWDDAIAAIKADMESNQYWPNIWDVSDHGNWSLVTESHPTVGDYGMSQSFADSTYRAVYWLSSDKQSEIVLTTPGESSLPEEDLLAVARKEAGNIGLDISGGSLVVGDWTEGKKLGEEVAYASGDGSEETEFGFDDFDTAHAWLNGRGFSATGTNNVYWNAEKGEAAQIREKDDTLFGGTYWQVKIVRGVTSPMGLQHESKLTVEQRVESRLRESRVLRTTTDLVFQDSLDAANVADPQEYSMGIMVPAGTKVEALPGEGAGSGAYLVKTVETPTPYFAWAPPMDVQWFSESRLREEHSLSLEAIAKRMKQMELGYFTEDKAHCDCGGSGHVPGIPDDIPCPYHATKRKFSKWWEEVQAPEEPEDEEETE
jgi:hypothetical protein